jgi:hypothetical protein
LNDFILANIFSLSLIIGIILYGIQIIKNSESFSFPGLDIIASKADRTPVIISADVLITGGN